MTHFGILCPPAIGHLNPMTTLGHELRERGHCVTLFGVPDTQSKTIEAGLEFSMLGESEFPVGSVKQSLEYLGRLNGISALMFTIEQYARGAAFVLGQFPAAIKEAGVQALLIDQTVLEGSTIADFLDIPFVTVCSALMLNSEPGIPPALTGWNYNPLWQPDLCNQLGYTLLNLAGTPIRRVIEDYRRKWKLSTYLKYEHLWSQLAQISQQPKLFDFPRRALPSCFHFTGPYLNLNTRKPVSFPFEGLTGQPLIYASLGTVQNRLLWIFHAIAEACAGMDAQLVISFGGSSISDMSQQLPGSPIVVEYAPQLELLQRATLTITHAGLNTVLESLSNGVPMIAIPITNDQPGVAARIAWTGTGEVVPLSHLSVPKLRAVIQQVLTEKSYREKASRLQEAIRQAGGVSRAADIVEQVISTGEPVSNDSIYTT